MAGDLPLVSSYWLSLHSDKTFALAAERAGSADIATMDLQRGLETGAVRSLIRLSPFHPELPIPDNYTFKHDGLLPREFWWCDFYLRRGVNSWRAMPRTWRLRGIYVIYVWAPDLENIWPTGKAASGERAEDEPASDKPQAEVGSQPVWLGLGRPPFDWREIDLLIDWYITNRQFLLSKRGFTQDDFIISIRTWYNQRGVKAPAPDTLQNRIQKKEKQRRQGE